MRCFYLDESYFPNKYCLYFNNNEIPFIDDAMNNPELIASRVLHLSYTDFLRYARDRLGAELIGKNEKHVVALFERNELSHALIELLNSRMKYIVAEYNSPFEYKEGENGTIDKIPFVKNENND